jgi:hypothetical protein
MTDYSHLTGSELNALIAEARGWTKIDSRRQLWRDPDGLEALLPDWVSSLDRAWELFVELVDETCIYFGRVTLQNTPYGTVIDFLHYDGRLVQAIQHGNTPAHTICLAWLWWMENKRNLT